MVQKEKNKEKNSDISKVGVGIASAVTGAAVGAAAVMLTQKKNRDVVEDTFSTVGKKMEASLHDMNTMRGVVGSAGGSAKKSKAKTTKKSTGTKTKSTKK